MKSSNAFARRDRVSGSLRREMARLVQEEFRDPRAGLITVLEVDLSPNLADACVFVSVFPEAQADQTLLVLNRAAGFFRSQLAKTLRRLRIMPKIRFAYDDSLLKGQRIEDLLTGLPASSETTS